MQSRLGSLHRLSSRERPGASPALAQAAASLVRMIHTACSSTTIGLRSLVGVRRFTSVATLKRTTCAFAVALFRGSTPPRLRRRNRRLLHLRPTHLSSLVSSKWYPSALWRLYARGSGAFAVAFALLPPVKPRSPSGFARRAGSTFAGFGSRWRYASHRTGTWRIYSRSQRRLYR